MENNEEIKVNETNEKINNEERGARENKGKKTLTVVIAILIVIIMFAVGIGVGLLLRTNDNNNSNKIETTQNNKEDNKGNSNVVEENNNTENSTAKNGNNLFDNISKSNFKKAEINIITEDFDYDEYTLNDYSVVANIINEAKNFEVNKIGAKSIPEMSAVIIYYDNTSILIGYHEGSNALTISTGIGETYQVYEGTANNNLTKFKNIVNEYVSKLKKVNVENNNSNSNSDNNSSNNEKISKRKVVNEYGDGTQTKEIEGRNFCSLPGTSARANLYYIDANNDLCRIELVDGLPVTIIANGAKSLEANLQEGKIYAYSITGTFMNNICQGDDNIVFEKH